MIKILLILVGILYFIFSNSDKQPKKPKHDFLQEDIRDAISSSDDYEEYKNIFVTKTKDLADNERCTLAEIKEQGGWMYAPLRTGERGGRQYFIYCGGNNNFNKIYLDVFKYSN